MKIKKRNKYRCIDDIFMGDTNELVYIKGKVYNSEYDNCITDELGDKHHMWDEEESNIYFTQEDNVNHPSHYNSGGIECIDAMIAAYGKEAVMHFCQCNAFKYQYRFDKKNGVEDLKKAEWYNNKYIELNNEN